MLDKLINSKYPLLIPDEYDYLKDFIADYEDVDSLYDLLSDTYKTKYFIDRFSTQILSKRLNQQAEFDSSLSRYSNEHKYIGFFKYMFEQNNQKCAIDNLAFNNSDLDIKYERLLVGLEQKLDQKDKLIYLHQFCTYQDRENRYFCIDNFELLEVFVKLVLREYEKCNFYFKNLKIMVMSCHDMSMPIFFVDEKSVDKYESILKQYNLFLRQNSMGKI